MCNPAEKLTTLQWAAVQRSSRERKDLLHPCPICLERFGLKRTQQVTLADSNLYKVLNKDLSMVPIIRLHSFLLGIERGFQCIVARIFGNFQSANHRCAKVFPWLLFSDYIHFRGRVTLEMFKERACVERQR